jgi:hypothetical protein
VSHVSHVDESSIDVDLLEGFESSFACVAFLNFSILVPRTGS